MSTWCCQMKEFYFVKSIPCQFIFSFICSFAWSPVKSNQAADVHSDDNKSRHYHFSSGPSLKTEAEWNIFVRWKNNLWSFYVLLRTLENNNTAQQKHTNKWKAPSVINLMGFAYFASWARCRQKKSHDVWKKREAVTKHTQKLGFTLRICSSRTHFWLKTWRFQVRSFLKLIFFQCERLKVKIINQSLHAYLTTFFLSQQFLFGSFCLFQNIHFNAVLRMLQEPLNTLTRQLSDNLSPCSGSLSHNSGIKESHLVVSPAVLAVWRVG